MMNAQGMSKKILEHMGALYSLARFLYPCEDAAREDLVQDTIVRALERAEQYTEDRSVVAWLLTLMKHRFFDQKSRGALWRRKEGAITHLMDKEPSNPEELLIEKRIATAVRESMERMPMRYSEMLHYVYIEGETTKKTCQYLGIPLGTGLSRVHRGKDFLACDVGHVR